MRLSVTDILTDILYPSSKSEKGMCDVNKDIFIEQQVRKPMEIPVTKPQDPLEVNEIIKGPLILENFGEVPKSLLVKL